MLEQVALPDVLLEPVQRDLWHVWTGLLHFSYASQTCQVSQLRCSIAPLFHCSITAQLLHCNISPLLHCFIALLIHFPTAPLLHSSTASLLHNEIPVLNYYFITPLLNFSVVHFQL